ncbi:unnamed protein product [Aphanomyces euteiches]|uniref:Magnesium transporter n=1 Tax=Aphanomyces euteiches TaxID=100861 RepID=A0A6G0XUD9_9STRA|nr:hypothetical protein Ae201684_001274 [Aphanomyces euteiches]KAH9099856.1 hypothetical protein Ae201684P_018865 [Aphanomyces euteiches]KAH9135717.1 hypothetical protein AeRB84_018933 [Aphanomyces euteiches]
MSTRFGTGVDAQPALLAESLMHNDMLVTMNGEILGMNGMKDGKRLALRFDASGNSEFQEVTRMEVLHMIQTGVKSMLIPAPPKHESRNGRSHSRSRFSRDGPVDIPAVHMRDLRKLDNVFSTSNEPAIMVRQQAILVNCDPVRAVIMRDVMLIFLPDGADSLVYHLKTNMKVHLVDAAAFEFAALEAILATLCHLFSTECAKIIPKGRSSLDKMAKDDSMLSELENLRFVKNEMSSLESRVAGMRRLLMSLLENEEDLHMMYLTKLYNEPNLVHDLFSFDTEDAESFLEVYLQEIYGTQTRVALMANNVQNTESIVMLKLDSKRNFLLSVDLSLTLLGTLLAVPTFIVGGFGMNLNSYIQQTDYVFWVVFGVCIAFVFVGYASTVTYLKHQGINMSWKY